MARPRLSWDSDPIINHLIHSSEKSKNGERLRHPEKERIFGELMALYPKMGHGKHAKLWFKERFDRQAYCVVFFERKWVWESEDGWRAYVGEDGVAFEVKTSLNDAGVLRAWESFYSKANQ